MDRSLRRRIAALLLMFITTLGTAMRTSGIENIRTVQILLFVSSGMCLGVALSLSMPHRKTPSAGTK